MNLNFKESDHLSQVLLPPANKVWVKVIFSEACDKNSVPWGGGSTWAGTPLGPGRYTPRARQVHQLRE